MPELLKVMPRPGPLVCAALLAAACNHYHLAPAREVAEFAVQPFVPDVAAFSVVCMIRTSTLAAGVTFVAYDNGVLVGATRGPTFFCYRAAPGIHHIAVLTQDETETHDVEVIPGERYYLHQGVLNVFGLVRTRGVWVDETTARGLVTQSRHVVLIGAPARERLALAEPVPARVEGAEPPKTRRRRARGGSADQPAGKRAG